VKRWAFLLYSISHSSAVFLQSRATPVARVDSQQYHDQHPRPRRVAAFGLASGCFDAIYLYNQNRILWAVVVQAGVAATMGITITGLAIILWPLAYYNHHLMLSNYWLKLPRPWRLLCSTVTL
jgi:hypothetical protein